MESQRRAALLIINRLHQAGFTAYFAGGCVRDQLLQLPFSDVDIATSATVDEITTLFEKTVTVGAQFGVVVVVIDQVHVEVATFRKDGSYIDGRHPTAVERGTPEEDAARRDFTINGIFYDPLENRIIDFVGGEQDLQNKILRAIGNPIERFQEDRLRMLRAVRFALRFDLTIDEATLKAIRSQATTLLPAVSCERIWQELEKMGSKKSYQLLSELGLLQVILPGFSSHAIASFPEAPTYLYPLFLFFEQGLPKWQQIARFFKWSSQLLGHCTTAHLARQATQVPFSWVEVCARPEGEIIFKAVNAFMGRTLKTPFREFLPELQRRRAGKTLLSGDRLHREGVEPGPEMGRLIRLGEEVAINERIRSEDDLIRRLRLLGAFGKRP